MMIPKINKFALKTLLAITLVIIYSLSLSQAVHASDGKSKAVAIQIAEQQTKGKAVRAQFKDAGKQSGFRVRLMKEGKVIHKFVSMQQIKQR